MGWFRQEWQAVLEDAEMAHTLVEQVPIRWGESEQQDLDWDVAQIRDELVTLGNNLARRVRTLCTTIAEEVEHHKGANYDMRELVGLQDKLTAAFAEFDQSICIDLDKLSTTYVGSLEALEKGKRVGIVDIYDKATGGLLPRNSPKEPELAQLVWHADFQRYWEAKSNRDRIQD